MRVGRPWSTRISQLVADSDLDINGYGLVTTNNRFKEEVAGWFSLRNRADTAYISIRTHNADVRNYLNMATNGAWIQTANIDGYFAPLKARDTGVGLVEIARLAGAPTAYFKLIGDRAYYDNNPLWTEMLVWGLVG